MSFLRSLGIAFSPLFFMISESNALSTSLTSSSPVSPIAAISLIENKGNWIEKSDGSYRSDAGSIAKTFTVRMDVFNTGCDGKETVEILVYGEEIEDDVDTTVLFSVKNSNNEIEFLSFINDWDGGMRIDKGTDIGGVFVAPGCDENNLYKIDNPNFVKEFLYGVSGEDRERDRLADGNPLNWYTLSEERIGHVSPLKYTIINDLDLNQITRKFSAPEFTESSCLLNKCFDTYDSGNDYVILFGTDQGTVKFDRFDVSVTCEGESVYPNEDLEYTQLCNAYGDPHFESWDGQIYHFQGEGYFDYVKSCDDSLSGPNYLPFKITARHDFCGEPYTCVRQVIITIDDGNQIIFPSYGDDITPTFDSDGTSAIGSHEFTDANGNKVKYSVDEMLFEISYNYMNENSQLEVYYTHDRLRIQTTDGMVVNPDEIGICGLCGTLDRNGTNELTRCDTMEIISNENVATLSDNFELIMDEGTAYENVNEFGESCCNKELDLKHLGKSDCELATPAPISEPIKICWPLANVICSEAYRKFCSDCNGENEDSKLFSLWTDGCSMDFCANEQCKTNIYAGNYGLMDAIRDGCLDYTIKACIADKYKDFFPSVIDFCT